jgi:hypothetical protein
MLGRLFSPLNRIPLRTQRWIAFWMYTVMAVSALIWDMWKHKDPFDPDLILVVWASASSAIYFIRAVETDEYDHFDKKLQEDLLRMREDDQILKRVREERDRRRGL